MIIELKRVVAVIRNQKTLLKNLSTRSDLSQHTIDGRIEDCELAESDLWDVISQLKKRNRGSENGNTR